MLALARTAIGFQLQAVGSTSGELRQAMGLDSAQIGLLIGIFLLPGIAVALPSGMIGNRFGDRRVVLAGLAAMAIGGAIAAAAADYGQAVLGRLLAGTGAVLLNVLLTKILTDRFANKEIVLAMAIMLNTFTVGIALGQFAFPLLAQGWGWPAAHWCAAAAAAGAFLLVFSLYREPPPAWGKAAPASFGLANLSRAEWVPICLIGLAWATLNGALVANAGFAPELLRGAGYSSAGAGFWLGSATVLLVVSIQLGGSLGQRYVAPGRLAWLGSVLFGSGLCLAALPGLEIAGLVAAHMLGGVGAGAVYATVGGHMRAENRAVGFGLFLTWLYFGLALIPMAAGLAARVAGSPAAATFFLGALTIASAVPVLLLRPVKTQSSAPRRE